MKLRETTARALSHEKESRTRKIYLFLYTKMKRHKRFAIGLFVSRDSGDRMKTLYAVFLRSCWALVEAPTLLCFGCQKPFGAVCCLDLAWGVSMVAFYAMSKPIGNEIDEEKAGFDSEIYIYDVCTWNNTLIFTYYHPHGDVGDAARSARPRALPTYLFLHTRVEKRNSDEKVDCTQINRVKEFLAKKLQ